MFVFGVNPRHQVLAWIWCFIRPIPVHWMDRMHDSTLHTCTVVVAMPVEARVFFVASTACSLVGPAHYTVLNATSHFIGLQKNSVWNVSPIHYILLPLQPIITKQHRTKNAMTKAKMWYGKYQLQKWYGICRVCRIGARTAAYQQTRSQQHSATPNACRVTGLSTADCKLRRWPPVAPLASHFEYMLYNSTDCINFERNNGQGKTLSAAFCCLQMCIMSILLHTNPVFC